METHGVSRMKLAELNVKMNTQSLIGLKLVNLHNTTLASAHITCYESVHVKVTFYHLLHAYLNHRCQKTISKPRVMHLKSLRYLLSAFINVRSKIDIPAHLGRQEHWD